jgi:hypothetical protein
LCRPRFFAGQLLTDDTLNRLERYIVEKNKLHNRYLHGWGVVCGLEVVCQPCSGVTVRPGYALSPCGEDIIVCKDAQVDVCALIDACKEKQRRDWECEPYSPAPNVDCREMDEEWVLAIRYDETSSRGIMALKGSGASTGGSGCGCGGSGSGGCGCRGGNGNGSAQKSDYATSSAAASAGKYSYRPAQETIAAQSEPTLTCEGYVFEVYKVVPEKRRDAFGREVLPWPGIYQGAIGERFRKCYESYLATLPPDPGPNATVAALYQWGCSLKESLQNDLFDYPLYDCQLSQALANFVCPDPAPFQNNATAYRAVLDPLVQQNLSLIGGEYIRYCLCSSLLPPCPEKVCDPRVPLATVTIRKDNSGNCRILRVCNLGKRKFVTTFVNLGYWFSFLPLVKLLRKVLEFACCRPFRLKGSGSFQMVESAQPVDSTQPVNNAGRAENLGGGELSGTTTKRRGFGAFAGRVWANRTRIVDAQTLFLGALGARDERGQPYLAETELKNPFYTLTVNSLAQPLLSKLPDKTLDIMRQAQAVILSPAFQSAGPQEAAAASTATAEEKERARTRLDEELSSLNARVSELQATVERQFETINELRERLDNKE